MLDLKFKQEIDFDFIFYLLQSILRFILFLMVYVFSETNENFSFKNTKIYMQREISL